MESSRVYVLGRIHKDKAVMALVAGADQVNCQCCRGLDKSLD